MHPYVCDYICKPCQNEAAVVHLKRVVNHYIPLNKGLWMVYMCKPTVLKLKHTHIQIHHCFHVMRELLLVAILHPSKWLKGLISLNQRLQADMIQFHFSAFWQKVKHSSQPVAVTGQIIIFFSICVPCAKFLTLYFKGICPLEETKQCPVKTPTDRAVTSLKSTNNLPASHPGWHFQIWVWIPYITWHFTACSSLYLIHDFSMRAPFPKKFLYNSCC